MTLWTDRVPDYGWILMAWAFFQTTSLLGVAMYGESKQPQRFSLRKLTQISGILAGLFQIPLVLCSFLVATLINTGAIGGITSDLDTGKIRDFLLTESTASGRHFYSLQSTKLRNREAGLNSWRKCEPEAGSP
jgi:hypothetical protein